MQRTRHIPTGPHDGWAVLTGLERGFGPDLEVKIGSDASEWDRSPWLCSVTSPGYKSGGGPPVAPRKFQARYKQVCSLLEKNESVADWSQALPSRSTTNTETKQGPIPLHRLDDQLPRGRI